MRDFLANGLKDFRITVEVHGQHTIMTVQQHEFAVLVVLCINLLAH